MEPTEISEFTENMEKGAETHMRTVSLIISVLAVLVAMVTVIGHRTHTEAVLEQAKASDQWNEYQSKKTRQLQLTTEVNALTLEPVSDKAAAEKKIEDDKKHIEKWNEELPEEQDKAREFEAGVRKFERRATRFDLAEPLLQIAVVLSSITLLTRQRLFVVAGVFLGIGGVIMAATAFFIS